MKHNKLNALIKISAERWLNLDEISDLISIKKEDLASILEGYPYHVNVISIKKNTYRAGEMACYLKDKIKLLRRYKPEPKEDKEYKEHLEALLPIPLGKKHQAPEGAQFYRGISGFYYKMRSVNGVMRLFRYCTISKEWRRDAYLEKELCPAKNSSQI